MGGRKTPVQILLVVAASIAVLATIVSGANSGPNGHPAPGSPRGTHSTPAKETSLRLVRGAPKPAIRRRLIPFGKKRKREMARYSKRHYGDRTWRLRKPRQIVQHFAVAPTLAAIYDIFRPDHPDPELGELPNVCAHFGVSGSGRTQQFVPLGIRCRHVVGLNHVTIGIEHTGYSDRQVLSNRRQMKSSLKLTKWLRCRFGIRIKDVIGHNESRSSRFHRERVKRLRNQTHGDFKRASMNRYRKRLRALGRC